MSRGGSLPQFAKNLLKLVASGPSRCKFFAAGVNQFAERGSITFQSQRRAGAFFKRGRERIYTAVTVVQLQPVSIDPRSQLFGFTLRTSHLSSCCVQTLS